MTTSTYSTAVTDKTKSSSAFRALATSDPELQALLISATEEEILSEAHSRGYDLTVRDLTNLVDPIEETIEISQEDLQAIAGGWRLFPSLIGSCDGCESGASCGIICQTVLGASEEQEPGQTMTIQAAEVPKPVRSYKLRRRR